ncbi:phosphoribosyltransferase [Microbacterium terricola]|uniref:Phosphoribosyltransferase domain-containing protein n=1 Tax=Microbacterium terricola TaxID=344163 RepID=A0ABM8DY51_9MICO|nr:phosphoribosyltransferase family protein [Microbacterium terricola]UYK38764.1 phosphoribosyltransferase family protein [Microbacterium terricola]BDV30544.1 hypothetical protein Microterr_12040 [Microbacterium terricola]
MAIFADRRAAGRVLADALDAWRETDAVVFGIPRGGVVVAAEVASRLDLPLAAVVVRKISAPWNEEYAVGAIAEGVNVVDADAVRSADVTPEQLAFTQDLERVELDRRVRVYGGGDLALAGRTVLVVDDGIATGASATAACLALRTRDPEQIVLAAPVAPAGWRPDEGVADVYVCPHRMRDFWAVGPFYDDFTQTQDDEVVRLLRAPR